jgi:hypothetical protein
MHDDKPFRDRIATELLGMSVEDLQSRAANALELSQSLSPD